MKFNEKTLKKAIKDVEKELKEKKESVLALEAVRDDLFKELKAIYSTPPKGTIKKALKRLGMYPKFKEELKREDNGEETHTEEDISTADIRKGSGSSSNNESSSGIFKATYPRRYSLN